MTWDGPGCVCVCVFEFDLKGRQRAAHLIPCPRRWLMTLESILRNILPGVTVICGLGLMDLETRREAMALLTSDHEKGPKYGAHLYFAHVGLLFFQSGRIIMNVNSFRCVLLACAWLFGLEMHML